ncbi:LysR family transcriptional regulator [Halocynthiibacter sp. C4]|uniref:LysR family transcriptional regulator n=1 Tax=Halocynthiibacter sp. C4 TaxID=2992758 RepID=UPI00237A7BA7|nr:LysR family transcriptional regulator [Halocynthiibacter sp. C4]MDE0588326.1 LysR family transcriptional regulator [Halocynthiibacter sp. C4]
MNWQAISFDWNQIRAFLATVEEGSFSGAARALNSTQPTIGRQITGLESALGLSLFERTVRGPILTDAGQDLVDHVRTMGEAASMIATVATGRSTDLSGEVSVTSSDLMASSILPAILLELQKSSPGIRVQIVASNDIRNLGQREADIAIRHVRPEQPDLIAKHIGDFRANFYAATSYFDRVGRPKLARDLGEHRFVGSSDFTRIITMLKERGVDTKPESFVTYTDSGSAMWEMVRAGIGIALLPEALGEVEPQVEKALPDFPSFSFPVWLVTHRELKTNRRIRLVFDALSRGLAQASSR